MGKMAIYNSQDEASHASPSSGARFWRNIPHSRAVQTSTALRLAPATARFATLPALHMEAPNVRWAKSL